MKYEVIFYEDERGRSPVKDFLDELEQSAKKSKGNKQLYRKTVFYLEMLSNKGTFSGFPYTRNIGDGLWELRPINQRVFFFNWDGNKLVLLHTFKKETRKTPQDEIDKAMKEMADWKENGKNRIQ